MILNVKEKALDYNNYLMLQSPRGFFFYKLARFLRGIGKTVYKINFNGGDLITFPSFKNTIQYRGRIDDFEDYLKDVIISKGIEVIFLYGDYKPYHKIAIKLCKEIGLPIYVFEEGYIRPHYITMEKTGINGWSKIPKNPDFYKKLPLIKNPEPLPTNNSYTKKTLSRFIHFLFLEVLRWCFPHYVPCKKYFPYLPTIYCWLRGITVRKILYKFSEKKIFSLLQKKLKDRYFLVPLQVHNDTQITIHSKYASIEDFITEVMESFSRNADQKTCLVFKHHPEDRGFKNYKKHIRKTAEMLNIKDRVFYVHDLHLPTLIKGCIGVVVVNSTVGLQALYHNRPVKVMGNAIYDMQGLTFQGKLDRFWQNQGKIDRHLFERFRSYVIKTTQLNGGFYGRFPFDKNIFSEISLKTFSTAPSTVKR